jgi:hypothetical protein
MSTKSFPAHFQNILVAKWTNVVLLQTTHVNVVHDCLKLAVFVVRGVDEVDGRVKVLDVLCVHLEEGREVSDDVADPLVGLVQVPAGHALAKLK